VSKGEKRGEMKWVNDTQSGRERGATSQVWPFSCFVLRKWKESRALSQNGQDEGGGGDDKASCNWVRHLAADKCSGQQWHKWLPSTVLGLSPATRTEQSARSHETQDVTSSALPMAPHSMKLPVLHERPGIASSDEQLSASQQVLRFMHRVSQSATWSD
jgi:hypothetical protein